MFRDLTDRGEMHGWKQTVRVGCDCDRYMEYGTTYLHSLRMMAQPLYRIRENKNMIQVWDWKNLAVVVQEVDSIFGRFLSKRSAMKSIKVAGVTYVVQTTRQMHRSV